MKNAFIAIEQMLIFLAVHMIKLLLLSLCIEQRCETTKQSIRPILDVNVKHFIMCNPAMCVGKMCTHAHGMPELHYQLQVQPRPPKRRKTQPLSHKIETQSSLGKG